MKKNLLFPSIALMCILILSSCSMQKRVYRNGYSIEWNHRKNEIKQNAGQNEISNEVAGNENNISEAPDEINEPIAKTEITDQNATTSSEKIPATPSRKKGIISKIIKEDTPEEIAMINNGSKAAAFKSGFKKGIKLMMPADDGNMTGWAVASFVLGILSLFAYYGSFVLGVLAIIFGIIAIRKIRNEGFRGNTLAWLGVIFGIIGIVLATIIIRVYV